MMHCPNCQHENPIDARFCMNCGGTLSNNCPNCDASLPADARYCMHCGYALQIVSQDDQARLTRLTAVTPEQLALKIRSSDYLSGERRIVTVLLIDVVGSTSLAESVGGESWSLIMNGIFDRIAPAIYQYEGTIAHLLGDAMLSFFGAPVAHEDDPVRAVHAALDVLEIAQEYARVVKKEHGIDFNMRACLNTGMVIIGRISDDLKYEFNAMGGAVNIAARIKFAARPMTVLVSEFTHRFVAPFFELEDKGAVDVKGRTDPVRVFKVGSLKKIPDQARGLLGISSPMVGREKEITILNQLSEAVRAGLGRGVIIAGEPGLGKTRLIQEWKSNSQNQAKEDPGCMWIDGHCLSYGHRLAYHLVIDLMHSIIGVPNTDDENKIKSKLYKVVQRSFADETDEVYAYLGHLMGIDLDEAAESIINTLDPQALQNQYAVAIRKLLRRLTTQKPIVVVLEDLHWADPSSTDLLVKLLPLANDAPILFCLVTRLDRDSPGWKLILGAREVLGGSLTEIELHALTKAGSRQLVANLLKIEALPDQVRKHILGKAEGNPFFVEEVIRMLIDRGAIIRQNGNWVAGKEIGSVEIPDNLQGLLTARIDQLPADVRHTLRVASIIGREFPFRVLEQVLNKEKSE